MYRRIQESTGQHMKFLRQAGLWLALANLAVAFPAAASEVGSIVAGNWVEVRGKLDEQGIFVAQRIDLVEPGFVEVLIGTVSTPSKSGEFRLLGQAVQISPKTMFSQVSATKLLNKRVKVEGHYRGPKRFSARKISARGAGRERLAGLVSTIKRTDGGYSLTVMNHRVYVPDEIELRHDKPIEKYTLASLNVALPKGKRLSEDDQFGEGFRIGNRLRFTTLTEARYKGEDNYDLDDLRDRGRQITAASFRGRLVLTPSNYGIAGQLEFRYTRLRFVDDLLGTFDVDDSRLGESFIFLDDPFEVDFDIQAGRMDFDDRREWIYDQNLDGLRVYWTVAGWLAELSATTTLSDGKPRDENTNNYVAYFSDTGRRFAAYAIRRETDLFGRQENITHLGLRAFGQWPPQHESWLEVAYMRGNRDSFRGRIDMRGWGLDVGTTRAIGKRWFLTAGYAFGQGDDNTRDGTDGTFRQTRLQDNNGK